MIRNSGA
jgi:ribosome-binding protein aMBF1 (putative translation factor)